MLSLAHTATGALIATKIDNSFLSIPLILISHYLEDYTPHWDVGTGLTNGSKKPSSVFKHELIDLGLSFIYLYLVFETKSPGITIPIWLGALTAIIPDLLEAPRNFIKWEPSWLKIFNDFHHRFHHSTEHILRGLTPQIALLIIITFLA